MYELGRVHPCVVCGCTRIGALLIPLSYGGRQCAACGTNTGSTSIRRRRNFPTALERRRPFFLVRIPRAWECLGRLHRSKAQSLYVEKLADMRPFVARRAGHADRSLFICSMNVMRAFCLYFFFQYYYSVYRDIEGMNLFALVLITPDNHAKSTYWKLQCCFLYNYWFCSVFVIEEGKLIKKNKSTFYVLRSYFMHAV